MAGQVCGKCGQLIKSGEKIIYEEGKPTHYPRCPEVPKSSTIFPFTHMRLEETNGKFVLREEYYP